MITGYTKVAAVIGDPVRHSLSPTILNAAFSASRLDWRYVAFPVKAGKAPEALEAMEILGIEGFSVTMPHKASIAETLENVTPAAQALGAVNCVFRQDGELWGDSTDGDGLVESIIATIEATDSQVALNDKQVLVVGTGGAGRSIVEAIGRRSSAELYVAGRTDERVKTAARLADGATAIEMKEIGSLSQPDIIINATNVGMAGGPDEHGSPIPANILGSKQTIIDIVYQPRLTPLLAAANEVGATTMNGVPMLVHQAALAFRHWTDLAPPLAAMTKSVDSELT